MNKPIIEVENLSKLYHIGAPPPKSLRDAAEKWWHRLIGRSNEPEWADKNHRSGAGNLLAGSEANTFWALKDVSFSVNQGEVIGVIGRNGAGKSTLLKILSQITEPTSGRAVLRGRVASLLEVGTGFHPELTGRENIYLNGAILGMRKQEIDKKLEQIVNFSEIEKFIETPVKRYSSGMYVRLAFAVAAHLDPEILLIDEVLAVGDGAFQKKCLGKMSEVAATGKTIIFVSHNMDAIARITKRVLYLNNGMIDCDSDSLHAIQKYLNKGTDFSAEWQDTGEPKSDVKLTSMTVKKKNGSASVLFNADEEIIVEIGFRVVKSGDVQVAYRLNSSYDGTTIFSSALGDTEKDNGLRIKAGHYIAASRIPANLLRPGKYHFLLVAYNRLGQTFDCIDQVLQFEVSAINSLASIDQRWGAIAPLLPWQTRIL